MKYKFYIYEQNVLTNFDKYDLDDYTILRPITQLTKWSIKIERDREFYTVIRETFGGDITVDGTDYTALIALTGETKQYAVVIHRYCAGVWEERWKGFFSFFDFKVDEDRCQLSFTPSPWDDYTPIFDQMPVERNILAADTGETIMMNAYEYGYESMPLNGTYVGPVILWGTWAEHPNYPGEQYYLYSAISTFIQWVPTGPGTFDPQFSVSREYRRDIGFSNSATVGPSPDPDWVMIELVSVGVYKWARPYLDSVYTTYSYVVNGMNYSEVLQTAAMGPMVTFNGCITLKSIIDYFTTFFDLTYVSNFFNDDPCPMGGETLDLTMLQQISNIRDTADPATKGMMKLKDLLLELKNLNVYWHIDSNGDFRVEHRKYFDYGLSYAYAPSITLDLTVLYPANILHLNRYEYSKPNLYRFEKLEFQFSYFTDWIDAGIEYPQLSIMGNEEQTTTSNWGTDLVSMNDGKDELPKVGWALLNVNLRGAPFAIRKVTDTIGAISGVSMQNARFSPANILRDLWTYGRILPTGNVNGAATTFDTVERLKKQVELNIPLCCQDIDFNGLFRTPLGDGLLDIAEEDAQTGNLKLNLTYE